ncbi:MAG: hypothetical protein ABR543_16535 [Gemmatimonadaceae bacterium]
MTNRISWIVPLAVSIAAVPAGRLEAQRAAVGVHVAIADYREQNASLRFQGGGAGVSIDARYRRLGLHADAARLRMETTGSNAGSAEAFDMTQVGVAIRVRVARTVGLEAGVTSSEAEPRHAAQAVGVLRLGAYSVHALAPGASMSVRANYLAGAKFSGGGSAPFGVALGLGASYGPGSGRIRFTGDFGFQRLDRRTNIDGQKLNVPIQSSITRLGLALVI